jgi:hypothetical protein
MDGGYSTLGGDKNANKFYSEFLKGRDHFKEIGIHKRMILDWILVKQCGTVWT